VPRIKRGAPVSHTGAGFAARVARYIGTPYVWGGDTPKGFDCSGLVEYALSAMGLRGVPRTSEEQYRWTARVTARNLQAGDLIFMNFPGEVSPGHVLIYSGGQLAVHAPKPGALVQQVPFRPVAAGSAMWGGTVVGYGRVPGLTYAYAGDPARGPVGPRGPVGRSRPGTGGSGGGGGVLDAIGGWFSGGASLAGEGLGAVEGLPGEALHAGESVLGHVPVLGPLFKDAAGLITAPVDFLKAALWMLMPQTWLRITEFVVGAVLMVLGLRGLFLIFASSDTPGGITFNTVGGAASSVHQRKVQPAADQLVPGNAPRRKRRREKSTAAAQAATLAAKYGKVPF